MEARKGEGAPVERTQRSGLLMWRRAQGECGGDRGQWLVGRCLKQSTVSGGLCLDKARSRKFSLL